MVYYIVMNFKSLVICQMDGVLEFVSCSFARLVASDLEAVLVCPSIYFAFFFLVFNFFILSL